VLARTYDSFVHLVVRADSPITSVADLRGRAVGLGAHGSGTRVIAQRVLATAGLSSDDVAGTADPLEASSSALRRGRLDAFFFVSGLPNSAVAELTQRSPVRLLDLGGLVADMTTEHGTEYTPGPVPASTYELADAVDTISVKNYVVVRPDLPDDLAYAVTRVMFEEQPAIDRRAPGIRQPNLGAAIFTSPLPLHPGAERYFRERRD
jgi:TRAP transporter TAXI family solute receptor